MDLEVLHPLCHEQESSLRHLQRNRRSQGRKTCFTCRKAERGQAQPQLYGTSYFFVSFALIGPLWNVFPEPLCPHLFYLQNDSKVAMMISALLHRPSLHGASSVYPTPGRGREQSRFLFALCAVD